MMMSHKVLRLNKLNKERVYESFEIYLQQLCDVLAQLLGTKNEKREIRVHFRYWTAELGDKNLYKPLVIAGEGMKIKADHPAERRQQPCRKKHILPLI